MRRSIDTHKHSALTWIHDNRTDLFVLLLFIALACIYWYPLPLYLRTGQLEDPIIDTAFNQWIIGWGNHALTYYPWRFFEANMFYPFAHTLAWGDNLFAITLFAVPLIPLFGLVGAYNILFLLSTALSGFTAYLLTHHLTKQRSVAIIAGVMWGLTAMRIEELGHIQILALQWVPLVFLFAELVRTDYRRRYLVGFVISAFLVLTTNIYLALFTVICFTVYGLVLLTMGKLSWLTVTLLSVGWLAAGLLALPLYLPSIMLQIRHPVVRGLEYQVAAGLHGYLPWPWPGQWLREMATQLGQPITDPRANQTLGLLTYVFALLGFIRLWLERKSWRDAVVPLAFLTFGMVAIFASTGPVTFWHEQLVANPNLIFSVLYNYFPGFDALRIPARLSFFGLLGLVVFGAWGATIVVKRLTIRTQYLLVVVAILWIMVEQMPSPVRVTKGYDIANYPSYAWLAKQPGEFPILELPIVPMGEGNRPHDTMEAKRMFLSTYHWKRRISGSISPYRNPDYIVNAELLNAIGDNPQAIKLLQEWKVKYVLYYPQDVIQLGWGTELAAKLQKRLEAIPELKQIKTFPEAIIYSVEESYAR